MEYLVLKGSPCSMVEHNLCITDTLGPIISILIVQVSL